MTEVIPDFLMDMLFESYGEELSLKIANGYKEKRAVTLRVNTLKSNMKEIKSEFDKVNIKYKDAKWNKDALIIDNVNEKEIKNLKIYQDGKIYLQSLSSMIPPIILNPKANENILDMAAAPGGKTTQMSALSNNEAMITACEKNKIRAEKLRYNLEKQGATRVNVMMQDARNLDNFFSFDKILLDSPCSGSGTDTVFSGNFTKELINRSMKLQEELLRKAIKILKPNGEIVYSTCSILKEENENILSKILKDCNVKIIKIEEDVLQGVPFLPSFISGTICVLPNEHYEGFFIAKIRKND